ncbi:MAG: hypothetical protein AAFV33_17280, partial [Chloroflexota bacterium]
MKKTLLLIIAAMLLLPVAAFAQDDTDDAVAVTIYNQGTALVQDVRTFSFDAGVNVLDFTDVASQIDATSVSFNSITDPEGTIVLEQNYVYDLVGAEALYNRYIDEEIRITMADGTEFAGILLSARGGGVIIQLRDGSVTLLQGSEVRD